MSSPEHEFDCAQLEDAAVYVLGALEGHEAETYAEHLKDCAVCSVEVSKLQVSADSLALAAPQMLAPVNLRSRVMSTVHAEAELLKAAGSEADRPVSTRERWRWRLVPAAASAAALAVGVFVGAVAINGGSQTKTRVVAAQTSRLVQAAVTSPGHRATAVVRESGGQTLLEVANLPAPPHGHIYEVWLLKRGSTEPEPTSALFSVNNQGNGLVGIPGDLKGVAKVLVTAEPFGGSLHPTSTPFIVATV